MPPIKTKKLLSNNSQICWQIVLPAPRPIAVVIIASGMGEFVNVKVPPPGVLPPGPPGGLMGTLSAVVRS